MYPGSGAEEAGIRPRDRIVSVDGDPCVSIPAVRGPEGTTVTLGVESPGEPVRDVVVERRRIDQRTLPISSRMGPDGDIGYLRLAAIDGEAMIDALVTTMASFTEGKPIEGLILDLRSTNVGSLPTALALLGHLMEGTPGTLYSRTDSSPLVLPDSASRQALADVPIAVLVDDRSAGDSERIAMMLQAAGRARVIGQPTLGRTRGITELPFPDGSLLQLVTVGLELSDGTRPEKAGVTPDVPVDGEWLTYPEAEDPWILAALDLLSAPGGARSVRGPGRVGIARRVALPFPVCRPRRICRSRRLCRPGRICRPRRICPPPLPARDGRRPGHRLNAGRAAGRAPRRCPRWPPDSGDGRRSRSAGRWRSVARRPRPAAAAAGWRGRAPAPPPAAPACRGAAGPR